MTQIVIKPKSIYLDYQNQLNKYNNDLNQLNIDQKILMKVIISILSIRDFRLGYGQSKKHLIHFLEDYINSSNYHFISKAAYKKLDGMNTFHNNTFKRSNLNDLYEESFLPLDLISNELINKYFKHSQILRFLNKLKNKIVITKEEKKILNKFSSIDFFLLNSESKLSNLFINKLIGAEICDFKIKLIN